MLPFNVQFNLFYFETDKVETCLHVIIAIHMRLKIRRIRYLMHWSREKQRELLYRHFFEGKFPATVQ